MPGCCSRWSQTSACWATSSTASSCSTTSARSCGSFGIAYHPAHYDIVLPVGISFYTFATMSYTLDVYLRRAAPAQNLLDYALFVTFFPHLVAGPIMRPTELVPQFAQPRRASARAAALRAGADDPRAVQQGRAGRQLPGQGGRARLRRSHAARGARLPGPGRSPSAGRSSATSPATRPPRSGRRCAWALPCRTISASPTPPSASRISGGAGTSRCPPGCATTCTFRSAATATERAAPTRR